VRHTRQGRLDARRRPRLHRAAARPLEARGRREGFATAKAEDQFLRALQWCGSAFRSIGVTLVIEPLNRKESNQCNHVMDGVAWARKTGLPNVKGLADFYHMDEESEPLSMLSECGSTSRTCTWPTRGG